MKLDQVLKEIGMSDSWEQQLYVLRCIRGNGTFVHKDVEYGVKPRDTTYSGVDIASLIIPTSGKYETMIKELTHPENFLDMLEFSYIKGVLQE